MALAILLLAIGVSSIRNGLSDQAIKRRRSEMIKGSNDPREYKTFVMDNGLPVVLIRDETSFTSSASINVDVGSFMDPTSIPGVAHFLEHMLFLGSDKYPEEGSFDKMLGEHGGYSNAYTASENTNYFFSVDTAVFEDAVDMFAHMFTSPLLSMNATNREANAINSEHSKNLNNDGWRFEQVQRDVAQPGHPYNRFETGNTDTLMKDVDASHDALLQLFHGHYCVPNMHLTVLSSLPLSNTEELARKSFADVRQTCDMTGIKDVGVGEVMAKINEGDYLQPYNDSILGHYVMIRSLKDVNEMTFHWQTPPQGGAWKEKNADYVGSLLAQEGVGSLTALLRDEKSLIGGLSAGPGENFGMFGTFEVSVDLTDEGKTKVHYVAGAIMNYISLLRGDDAVASWRYDELKTNSKLRFDWKEKESPEDYTSDVASQMQHYPTSHVLFADYDYDEFNAEGIKEFLEILHPSNLVVFHLAQEFISETNEWHKDKYYGVEYSTSSMKGQYSDGFYKAYEGEHQRMFPDLKLPQPSEYIVTDTNTREISPEATPADQLTAAGADAPAKLIQNDYQKGTENQRVVAWWLQDTQFLVPKAHVIVKLMTPTFFEDVKTKMAAQLFAAMASDSLNAETDAATSAGYSYNVGSTTNGLAVSVSGFSQHLNKFLSLVLDKLNDPSKLFKKARFSAITTAAGKNLANSLLQEPYKRIGSFLSGAIESPSHDPVELSDAISSLEFDDILAFKDQHLSDVAMEILVFGDASLDDARAIVKSAAESLPSSASSESLLKSLPAASSKKIGRFVQGSKTSFRSPPTDDSNPNSCTLDYWQYGKPKNDTDRLYLSVLSAVIHGPAYDQLRTKEQLGYIVSASGDRRGKVMGLRVLIESLKPASYLHDRIKNFMDTMADPMIEKMTKDDFDGVVETLNSQLSEAPQGPSDVLNTAYAEISSREYRFSRRKEELEALKSMTLSGFKRFYKKLRQGAQISMQLDPTASDAAKVDDETAALDTSDSHSSDASEEDVKAFEVQDAAAFPITLKDWRKDQDEYDMEPPSPLPACDLC